MKYLDLEKIDADYHSAFRFNMIPLDVDHPAGILPISFETISSGSFCDFL
jgi:hypothetical protein